MDVLFEYQEGSDLIVVESLLFFISFFFFLFCQKGEGEGRGTFDVNLYILRVDLTVSKIKIKMGSPRYCCSFYYLTICMI